MYDRDADFAIKNVSKRSRIFNSNQVYGVKYLCYLVLCIMLHALTDPTWNIIDTASVNDSFHSLVTATM